MRLEADKAQFGPAKERVQNEHGTAQFGAVQLVLEMQNSAAKSANGKTLNVLPITRYT